MMINGFSHHTVQANGQSIAYSIAGSGPPVLLLHGFPQTRMMWHEVAPALAERYTVVAADLRGYGQSSKPDGDEAYSFRHMAEDQRSLMQNLGFEHFHLVGHDRGARVTHRMALDHTSAVLSLTVMDIIPTHRLLCDLRQVVATAYYHWFFLAQPSPLPEWLIASDPDFYFESCLQGWGASGLSEFSPKALESYREAWRDPETIRSMCADYRATIQHDLQIDSADQDRSLDLPSLVLYGQHGKMAEYYDVPHTWSVGLNNMRSAAIPGGHFFVDQNPQATTNRLLEFLPNV